MTSTKDKLRMNMKVVLDSKFQKDVVIVVEDSSSDEKLQVAYIEHHIVDQTIELDRVNQTLEEIEN